MGGIPVVLTEQQRNKVQESLKVMQEAWVKELKQGKKSYEYIDVDTVRQILSYACGGITTWDFIVKQQWVEDAIDSNGKNVGIVHVLGSLTIHGIGTREQFGSKVRVSANDYRADDYKGAASDALKKCALLFGVCEQLYSKDITSSLPVQDVVVAPKEVENTNVSPFKKTTAQETKSDGKSEVEEFDYHRRRLNIKETEELEKFIRDFMQSDKATKKDINQENIGAFNRYLSKFSTTNGYVV